MSCGIRQVAMFWQGAVAISTTAVFIPSGQWMSTDTINGGRGYGALAGKTGNFQGQPAVEYTNDVRVAGTVVAVGAAITANGVSDPTGFTALSVTAYRFIRTGWLVSLTAGAVLAGGNLSGVIEFSSS